MYLLTSSLAKDLGKVRTIYDTRYSYDSLSTINYVLKHICFFFFLFVSFLFLFFLFFLIVQIQVNIPKRRAAGSDHTKSLEKFFKQVLAAIVLHINFEIVQCVVIAGPGFIPVSASLLKNSRY